MYFIFKGKFIAVCKTEYDVRRKKSHFKYRHQAFDTQKSIAKSQYYKS